MLKKRLLTFGFALALVLSFSDFSFAAMDFSNVSVNLDPVYSLAVIIVGSLVGMVAVRKVIKLVNRS